MKRLLVAEQWDSFSRAVLPPHVGYAQRRDMRRAFYAGAQSILYSMMTALSPKGDEPTEDDIALISNVTRELSDFAESVTKGAA